MSAPREQLTRIIGTHYLSKPTGGTAAGSTIRCTCGWSAFTWCGRDHATYLGRQHVADAIIAAGWTPPPHPEEEEEPFSRMSYEAMEAKLAQQESAPRIT